MNQIPNMEDVVSVSIQVNQPSISQKDMLDVQIHYSDASKSDSIHDNSKIQPENSIKSAHSSEVIQQKSSQSPNSNIISSESQAIKDLSLLQTLNQELQDQLNLLRIENDSLLSRNLKLEEDFYKTKQEQEVLARKYEDRLENLTKYSHSLSQEMEDLEETNNSLLRQLNSTSDLLKALEDKYSAKSQERDSLSSLLESREKRKSSAEIILIKQEKMNKELMEANSKLQARNKELEKRVEEYASRYNKVRQDLAQVDEILKERDEQMHKAIKRIKLQDAQICELQKDNRNKETAIAKLQKAMQGMNVDAQKEINSRMEKGLKAAMNNLAARENEVIVLRDLLKSYQSQFKQKEHEVIRLKKNFKLPPLKDTNLVSSDNHISTTSIKSTSSIRKIIRIPDKPSPLPIPAKASKRYSQDKFDNLNSSLLHPVTDSLSQSQPSLSSHPAPLSDTLQDEFESSPDLPKQEINKSLYSSTPALESDSELSQTEDKGYQEDHEELPAEEDKELSSVDE